MYSIPLIRRNYTWNYINKGENLWAYRQIACNYAKGISFDLNAWKQFQENMGLMSTYLNGNSKIKINLISFANIFVTFTLGFESHTGDAQAKWKFFKGDFIRKYASRTNTIANEENKILFRRDYKAASISRNGESNQICRCTFKTTDDYRQC